MAASAEEGEPPVDQVGSGQLLLQDRDGGIVEVEPLGRDELTRGTCVRIHLHSFKPSNGTVENTKTHCLTLRRGGLRLAW